MVRIKSFTLSSRSNILKPKLLDGADDVKIEDAGWLTYDGSDQESRIRNFTDGAYTQARSLSELAQTTHQ